MAKPKKKTKESVEANEFLQDLIAEVKSMDDSDDDAEVIDELSDEYDGSKAGIKLKADNEDDLPTVFAHIKKDVEAPKLRRSLHEEVEKQEKPDRSNDKTIASMEAIPSEPQNTETAATSSTVANSTVANNEPERTIAVEGARGKRPVLQEKVVSGALKGTRNGQVYTSLDASLAQAETLKIAQSRIKELEVEIDRLRSENDDLASAGDVVTKRMEDVQIRLHRLEKEKNELAEQSRNEQLILKGNLQFKDTELSKTKTKLEDLEMRIKSDFQKIRVRERELENRLELVRGEKQALMRAKDEKILDLQRKLDQYKSELDLYRAKVQDLNKLMETQHDQMQKTIRTLRIALVNLEYDDSTEGLGGSSSSEDNSDDLKKAK